MKKKVTILSFLLMFFLSLIFIFAIAQVSIAETTLNDNVNIEGELFLNGDNSSINFSDGSIQATAANSPWCQILPANERFELVMNNEAVLDRETGLVWQKNYFAASSWADAQYFCYNQTIGGRGGWRLPSVEELRSLVDDSQSDPALPDGHPFGSGTSTSYYWSSTTCVANTSHAWVVSFYNGGVYHRDKLDSHVFRAVRSGQ